MSLETLESQKDDVLNETVAQDIFRELKDLRAYVDTQAKRWVLELIQNALDVSKEQGVDVRIDFDGSRLLFSHNGRSFTEKELIHLIYHGSTKVESEGIRTQMGSSPFKKSAWLHYYRFHMFKFHMPHLILHSKHVECFYRRKCFLLLINSPQR